MDWTRSIPARVVSLACGIALIVRYADERNGYFWCGIVLMPVAVIGLVVALRSRRPQQPSAPASSPVPLPGEEVDGGPTRVDATLAELWDVPGVAAAFAAGPDSWRQVSYLDEDLEPWAVAELAEFMWVVLDEDGWSIGLGDEVKPYLDLDIDPDDDPIVHVLRAHPGVTDAWHDDREVYRIQQDAHMSKDEFAALAARALVAHHELAAARLPG